MLLDHSELDSRCILAAESHGLDHVEELMGEEEAVRKNVVADVDDGNADY